MRLLIPALLFLLACGDTRRNIRDFYYPVKQLQEGLVYRYELSSNDSVRSDYWYFRTFVRDTGIFLSATNYDYQFQIAQMVTERITTSGALAQQYTLYETDSSGKSVPTVARLLAPDVFPFSVSDSNGVFLFHLDYPSASDSSARIYLLRNRRYLGKGPDYTLNGQTYPTVRFRVAEAIGNQKEGNTEIEGQGEEWYAQGLGLVATDKYYGPTKGLHRSYMLKERMSMEQFIERQQGRK
jgi:hypothetical protein